MPNIEQIKITHIYLKGPILGVIEELAKLGPLLRINNSNQVNKKTIKYQKILPLFQNNLKNNILIKNFIELFKIYNFIQGSSKGIK